MNDDRIITSLLDTDLYKLTMMQAVLHKFPSSEVEYKFICRNKCEYDLSGMIKYINRQIQMLSDISLSTDESLYLEKIRFFKPDFIDFLKLYKFNPSYVSVTKDKESSCGISIRIKGPWLYTILFEVPILAIVNETYFNAFLINPIENGLDKLRNKLLLCKSLNDKNFGFSDFGTRRRFSKKWQEYLVDYTFRFCKENGITFYGTSNVWLAKHNEIKAIGTMAHEWLQAGQAMDTNLENSQKFMLESWVQEYRGDLGIALTDVIGIDSFLRDFDLYFSKLYDGVRHDSGDPFVFAAKIINHYEKLNIDPRTKTIVFSDGLTFPKAIEIYNIFKKRIKMSFGIGTNLTNDVGVDPINIVIKMIKCNGKPVAKISDSPGKGMCEDQSYVDYLKKTFKVV